MVSLVVKIDEQLNKFRNFITVPSTMKEGWAKLALCAL